MTKTLQQLNSYKKQHNCFQGTPVIDKNTLYFSQDLLINDWFSGESELKRNLLRQVGAKEEI